MRLFSAKSIRARRLVARSRPDIRLQPFLVLLGTINCLPTGRRPYKRDRPSPRGPGTPGCQRDHPRCRTSGHGPKTRLKMAVRLRVCTALTPLDGQHSPAGKEHSRIRHAHTIIAGAIKTRLTLGTSAEDCGTPSRDTPKRIAQAGSIRCCSLSCDVMGMRQTRCDSFFSACTCQEESLCLKRSIRRTGQSQPSPSLPRPSSEWSTSFASLR